MRVLRDVVSTLGRWAPSISQQSGHGRDMVGRAGALRKQMRWTTAWPVDATGGTGCSKRSDAPTEPHLATPGHTLPHLATPSAQARPTGCSRAQSLCLGLSLGQAHGLGSRYRCSWPRTSSHPTVVWIATGCRATSSACWLGHKRWPSKTAPGLVKHRWIYNEFHGLAQKWRMYICMP